MGAVYLAHDTQLDRQVAVKTPRFSGSDAAEMVERFYREARAAASFRHPNICPVHDASEIDGQHCLVMAYIDGHPLSRYIAGGKPQNERAVATTVRKLALALDQAHQRGVVHRDLKPANVMVDRQGEPLVMDFGLARRFRGDEETRITQTGFLLGTPAYMSPEQIEGDQEKIGPATDIYSLGVILYEVLTGKLPFSGSIGPLLRKIATEEPPDAAAARPGLDSRLASICRRMMAKKREERPASMRAVADELGEFLKSLRTDGGARKKHSATSDQQAESNECLALNRLLDDIAIDRLPASSAGHRTPPDRRKLILLGGGAGALLVLAGIIITIVNRNGTKTRVEAPDAESITISHTPEGTAAVRPGGEKESGASVETEDRVIADAPPPVGNSPEEAIRPLARLSGHAMRVTAVAYSADGRHFFSTGGTSDPLKIEFFVWDATTRQVDWSEVLEAGKAHRIVPFSDGRHVLIGGELGADASQPSLHVLDLETRKLVEPMNVGHPSGQAFDATSDGRLVLYRSGDRNLVLWDRMENREAKRYSLDELKVEGTPYLVMLSPDGKYAVLHSRGKAWHVVMLDLQTGTITSRYRGRNLQWNSLCWSRDSARILMSGAFGNIAVWEAESGQVHSQLRVPEVKDAGASTALFLPDERYVVLGQREGRVRLLDLKEGREVAFATAPPGTTTWLALSPDGRLAVTAEGFVRSQHKAEEKPTDNALRIWQLPVTAEPPSSKRE